MSKGSEGKRAGEPADEVLVRLALDDQDSARARAAAAELFGRYRRCVYIWCFRYVRNHEKAMDLAQDALLNAYRTLGSFQAQSRFSSWIYAIAKNRCLNEIRRPALFAEEEVDLDRLAAPTGDPAQELVERLDEEALLRLMRENLEPAEQEVIWLRCFERMPVEMITEVLAVRQATGARGLLQRARRKLRAALIRFASEQETR